MRYSLHIYYGELHFSTSWTQMHYNNKADGHFLQFYIQLGVFMKKNLNYRYLYFLIIFGWAGEWKFGDFFFPLMSHGGKGLCILILKVVGFLKTRQIETKNHITMALFSSFIWIFKFRSWWDCKQYFECGTTVSQGHNLYWIILLNNYWHYCCFCSAEPCTVVL